MAGNSDQFCNLEVSCEKMKILLTAYPRHFTQSKKIMVGFLCSLLSLGLVTSLFVLMTQHRQELTQYSQAPASAALSSPNNSQNFVKVCRTSLCLNGKVWYLYGASTNGATADANTRMDMAVQGHLNTVRLTDWLHDNA